MQELDTARINKTLKIEGWPLPIPGTLRIEDGKLQFDIRGRADKEGTGVINSLFHAGLNCVIDEKGQTDENQASDDHGIVHIWFKLADEDKLWRG